jgi:hypothetical protein
MADLLKFELENGFDLPPKNCFVVSRSSGIDPEKMALFRLSARNTTKGFFDS